MWRGEKQDVFVVRGGVPSRAYVVTKDGFKLDRVLSIMREPERMDALPVGFRESWLKNLEWPRTKIQNDAGVAHAAFNQASLLGRDFLHDYGPKRIGGCPKDKEMRELINLIYHNNLPPLVPSTLVNEYVDHEVDIPLEEWPASFIPPRRHPGWGDTGEVGIPRPKKSYTHLPQDRIAARVLGTTGTAFPFPTTELIQFVALGKSELKELLQFLMEREELLAQPGIDWQCYADPLDWILDGIAPRDLSPRRGIFDPDLTPSLEPRPIQLGDSSTILFKEQLENGWVHCLMYIAPLQKAMENMLEALGIWKPQQRFRTWKQFPDGTRVIHVGYDARKLEEVIRVLDALEHHTDYTLST